MSTSKDYDVSLWEQNFVQIPAVQGESQSRTIYVHLTEEVSVQNALGNWEIRQKPFDATGYSVQLYVEKSDETKVFFDGTVTDAVNGTLSFLLPYQATTVNGEVQCTVYLTKADGTTLKAIGITLDVQENDLEGAIESSNDFSALVVALNSVKQTAEIANQASQTAKEALTEAQALIATTNTAAEAANDAAVSANAGAAAANQAAVNAGSLYQMVSPLSGKTDYVTNIINELAAYIFQSAITAQEMDDLNITAQNFDALNLTAKDFDTSAKKLLGGA